MIGDHNQLHCGFFTYFMIIQLYRVIYGACQTLKPVSVPTFIRSCWIHCPRDMIQFIFRGRHYKKLESDWLDGAPFCFCDLLAPKFNFQLGIRYIIDKTLIKAT